MAAPQIIEDRYIVREKLDKLLRDLFDRGTYRYEIKLEKYKIYAPRELTEDELENLKP